MTTDHTLGSSLFIIWFDIQRIIQITSPSNHFKMLWIDKKESFQNNNGICTYGMRRMQMFKKTPFFIFKRNIRSGMDWRRSNLRLHSHTFRMNSMVECLLSSWWTNELWKSIRHQRFLTNLNHVEFVTISCRLFLKMKVNKNMKPCKSMKSQETMSLRRNNLSAIS